MYNFELKEEDENEDEIIEKRRQQRLAILQKYKHRECSDSPAISAVSSPTGSELSARDAEVSVRKTVAEKLDSKIDHTPKVEHATKVEGNVEESDMFADDYKASEVSKLTVKENEDPSLTDNWDDAEGYYRK